MRDPTQEIVRAALDYDPATGIFRWRSRLDRQNAWNARFAGKVAGGLDGSGYIQIVLNRVHFRAQRLAWIYVRGEIPAGMEVDHENLDKADGRFENLRLATHSQNTANGPLKSNNTVGYKGVSYRPIGRKHYRACIAHAGKSTWLGSFSTAKEAHAAWLRAAEVQHGEFARAK